MHELTMLYWLLRLKWPLSLKAIEHHLEYGIRSCYLDKPVPSIAASLSIAFVWKETPEGWRFWNEIYMDLDGNGKESKYYEERRPSEVFKGLKCGSSNEVKESL